MTIRKTAVQFAGVVTVLMLASVSRADATTPHTFSFTPAKAATTVSVAGDFNGWSTTATPMAKSGDAYTAAVPLSPGVHHYKFVVDGKWFNDPASDTAFDAEDGQGGKNSGVNITAAAAAAPAGSVSHDFHYKPDASTPGTAKAFVAGDFNGWSTTATPMTKSGDGSFTATVNVTPGVHHYKYVVEDKWYNDPASETAFDAPDGQGGKNSGFKAGDAK